MTAGVTTLAAVRTLVRQRANMEDSQFVTDDELNAYINLSHQELYGLLVQKYGADYFCSSTTFTTDGTNDNFALPSDFFKCLGVDVRLSSGRYVTLKEFAFADRNRFSGQQGNGAMLGVGPDLRYRIRGDRLWVTPLPASGQTLRMFYAPRLTTTTDETTITLSGVQVGHTITFSNYGPVTIVASGASGGYQINIGANDVETAENIGIWMVSLLTATSGDAFNLRFPGRSLIGDVSYPSGVDYLTVTALSGYTPVLSGSSSFTFSPTDMNIDGVNGWEEYIVVDAAIKCLQKEESDCSVLLAQKAAIVARIESEASNRDAGMPSTVSDTSTENLTGLWPGSGGSW